MSVSPLKHKAVRLGIVLTTVVFLALNAADWGRAQVQSGWSRPFRLSIAGRRASEAFLTSDAYGYVHSFWEEEYGENRSILMYSRFDGENWTLPVDIRILVPFGSIQTASPVVDEEGTLHLLWSEGDSGPVYYSRAPANQSLGAQNWRKPLRISIDAKRVLLEVDPKGYLHILYSRAVGGEPGLFYIRSEDEGETWSDAIWLDPDIKQNFIPSSFSFSLDTSGNLHAVWFYARVDAVGSDWIRYSRSTDGGLTWQQPRTIAQDEEEGTLNAASPVMVTVDDDVHIVWAQGQLFYRWHSYSLDAGETWTEPARFMDDLNGQAFEGLAVDSLGRVHYLGQIRYPQGIYHSIWDGDGWSEPELIYLVSRDPNDPIGNRIHAHHTHPAIRAGNQIVLTFADSPPEPFRRLFSMTYTMEDVAALTPVATPTPVEIAGPEAADTPTPSPTPLPSYLSDPDFADPSGAREPGRALWLGVVPALLVVGSIALAWSLFRNRS